MSFLHISLLASVCCCLPVSAQDEAPGVSIFDGETLSGWGTLEGDRQWWRVEDGVITGGSLTTNVPHNTFLATDAGYGNFDLNLEIRITGAGGFVNSGIQIRSRRVSDSSEMTGYQVDAGDGWWGKLYDESRRNRVLSTSKDLTAVEAAVLPGEWNTYRILAVGSRIRSWINGVPALDYIEGELDIPLDGQIGIQVHSGGKALVQVRNIRLSKLSATSGAMTWRRWDKQQSLKNQGKGEIQSAQAERAGFTLAPGFSAELVACEPESNKIVDIAFDDHGRMWAVTAVEYPIDGNESSEAAALYARGGRDRVLVFETPWAEGVQVPRTFAKGLVIPMAILPTGVRGAESVLVGEGANIWRMSDTDGDGLADSKEVVLSGFGIQDSHLLPHRFVRAPGGWVYMAQGAFNSSQVRTTAGVETTFNQCKVGRFQLDGSQFEIAGVGLNNIWGFVIDREGDKWIQEANDLGFPLVPFEHGASYPGIGSHRFRSHTPFRLPLAEFKMGGTGLSGLALSEDRGGFPSPWDRTFLLANPILSKIQGIRASRSETELSEVSLELAPEFLTSLDKNFRPVAIHFGPDGCLYVVDWYNPIISHNEVSRDHPDRDKTNSRVWRIRHESQERTPPVDVASLTNPELVSTLDSKSTWASRAAWHQIGARRALELVDELEAMAQDHGARTSARVLALWCLEDLGSLRAEVLGNLFKDQESALRREAARLTVQVAKNTDDLAHMLASAPGELDPRVRFAVIDALGAMAPMSASHTGLLLRMARPLDAAGSNRLWAADIAFERSKVRVALEGHSQEIQALVETPGAVSEPLFAAVCMGGSAGAEVLAKELARAGLVPNKQQLSLLGQHTDQPSVREAVVGLLAAPVSRKATLGLVLDQGERWASKDLAPILIRTLRALVQEEPGGASEDLLLRSALELRLVDLEPDVKALLQGSTAKRAQTCLAALSELGSDDAELFFAWAKAELPGSPVRRVAADALARIPGDEAFSLAVELWPFLGASLRQSVFTSLLASNARARRLAEALMEGDITMDFLDARGIARLEDVLGPDPLVESLREEVARSWVSVLHFNGGGEDRVDTNLTIDGPFTLEAWVRMKPGITNGDGLLMGEGNFDFNFAAGLPRLWCGPNFNDVIIATRPIIPGVWTHVAMTRDASGFMCLYLQGELNQTSHKPTPERFEGLDVGATTPPSGTHGHMAQWRLWGRARSAEEIAQASRLQLDVSAHESLILVLPGQSVKLLGDTKIERIPLGPPTQTPEEAAAESALFERFRSLGQAPADLPRGQALFATHCAACHVVAGQGADIGPVLDGVGAKKIEGLLRSILTPNAGVESGYRTLLVETGGELLDGFLAGQDEASILLRRRDRPDQRIPREEITSMRFDRLSLMPEGLLDPLTDQEVSDLLGYLLSL
ncbi:MAG: DUF1080 domain-containing protein [Planctomycetota bacterium]|nr:DUF1080 domain-containing protein [Planctomycetota bacterium]